VKESLFNILSNQIDFDGIKVCDIYAGSGSLGLEALSRGAAKIHFVEKNFNVAKVLSENILSLNVQDKCKIFKMESVKFSYISDFEKYDMIFADPPFFKDDIHIVVKNIMERGFLNDEGIFIIERSIQTEKKDVEMLGREPYKKIGDSLIYKFDK
jgi:16S rRNA (guanine966-N2)-methyltransferase